MPTTYKKVLDQGTSNPIVARLISQPENFMSAFPLTQDIKDRVFSVNLRLCKRLLAMEQFADWIEKENQAIQSDFLMKGLKKVGEDTVEEPQIMQLEDRAESYLQSAKLCISDIGQLFGALVGSNFDHKFHKVIASARGRFGSDDEFVKWLEIQESWIKHVLELRNALEHPNDPSGRRLNITNVEFSYSHGHISGQAPQWFLTGEPATAIVIDARNIINKLLIVSEDIFTSTLQKLFPEVPLTVRVIPELERDPKCPVRLELIPHGFLF